MFLTSQAVTQSAAMLVGRLDTAQSVTVEYGVIWQLYLCTPTSTAYRIVTLVTALSTVLAGVTIDHPLDCPVTSL